MLLKRFTAYALLLAIIIVLWISMPWNKMISTNTGSAYYLSSEQLAALKKKALQEKSLESTMRIERFYEYNAHDTNSYILWLKRASELGDVRSQERLADLANKGIQVDSKILEAKKKENMN